MRYENLYFNPQGLLTHIGDREDVSDRKYISAREFSALPTHALRTLQGVCMTVKHRFPDALLSCPSLMWIDLKIGIKNRTDLETTTRDIRWDNLETLQHLTLRGWPLLDYAPLSSLPALRTLCVETRRDVSQAVARWANFEALQGLGQLRSLDTLTLQGLPDGHIPESLEGLKRLKHLDLYDHRLILDEVGLIVLSSLTSLESLTLRAGSIQNIGEVCEVLCTLPEFKHLHVSKKFFIGGPSIPPQFFSETNNLAGGLPEALWTLTGLESLKLSGVGLHALPPEIGMLTALKTLDVSENNLTELPETLAQLSALTELDLSSNDMVVLPDVVGHLTGLEQLSLASNPLSVLPDSIGDVRSLRVLNLSRLKALEALPRGMTRLESLRALDLNFTPLTDLDVLAHLEGLRKLSMSHIQKDGLARLGHLFERMPSLTWLDISFQPNGALPDSIGALTRLEWLDISSSALESLPESMTALQQLTHLNMSSNRFRSFPEVVCRLSSLKTLNVSSCRRMQTLPEALVELDSLEQIDLSWSSGLCSFPDALTRIPSLRHLKFRQHRLEGSLPESLGNLSSLCILDVGVEYFDSSSSPGKLIALPDTLGNLRELAVLDVSYNRLKTLPESLSRCDRLLSVACYGNIWRKSPIVLHRISSAYREAQRRIAEAAEQGATMLDISGLGLLELPSELFELSALQEVNARDNKIAKLPNDIARLTRLRSLDLSTNCIKVLPARLSKCQTIERLDLSHNQLKKLSAGIGSMALQSLNIAYNTIEVFPKSFVQLTSLQTLDIRGNAASLPSEMQANIANLSV